MTTAISAQPTIVTDGESLTVNGYECAPDVQWRIAKVKGVDSLHACKVRDGRTMSIVTDGALVVRPIPNDDNLPAQMRAAFDKPVIQDIGDVGSWDS